MRAVSAFTPVGESTVRTASIPRGMIGYLALAQDHACESVRLGDDCLICTLKRRQLNGEVVTLRVVVHDPDEM